MKKILFINLLLFLFFQTNFAKPIEQISYEVSPNFVQNESKLKIKVTFQGNKSGVTEIRLPNEFGGQEKLYNCVQNLKVINSAAKLSDTEKPELKKITHSANEKITLEYDLIQDWKGIPSAGNASANDSGGYRPVINRDYFQILGSGFWIFPNSPDSEKLKVSITWKDFPSNWNLANSFGANQTKQKFQTDLGSFQSSIFIGGDYRITQKSVKGKPIFTAIRGKWKFTDEEFSNLAEKIIGAERDFWKDHKYPYYLITMLPLESENSTSYGGTGLTNSFATFVTKNVSLDDLSYLIAHEYFHNWNTIGFGGMKQPEALVYWFSEGFTDYYTHKLLLRTGLLDKARYINKYNEILSDYYISDVRNEPNQRLIKDFFTDYRVGKLPYQRGFLLATKWNRIILEQSNGKKSLDDLMRNILKDFRGKKIKEISNEYLLQILPKYAKYDFAKDVETYIESGETIGNFDGVFGNCVESLEVKKGKFELGFDFGKTRQAKLITAVNTDSNAYQAGLRDGQKTRGFSIYNGDVSKPAEIIIEENGKEKTIKYFPESSEKVLIPQFKFKENIQSQSNCFVSK